MLRRRWRCAVHVGWPLVSVVMLLMVSGISGVRLNLSGSMPIGLYVIDGSAGSIPRRGSIVLVCLPRSVADFAADRGYVPHGGACADGTAPVGKPVLAIPGDTVSVTLAGISLNGRLVPNSKSLAVDHRGRPLPQLGRGSYVVNAGEMWLVSQYSPFSFDSRYFGAVPIGQMRTRVRQLWTL